MQDKPWSNEPDREEFKHAGFPCILNRSPNSGAWCGYVGVPPSHPLHGKHYDVLNRLDDVSVHGGITYGRACEDPICHVPAPGEPDDVWWFGFDCAHGGDFKPGLEIESILEKARTAGEVDLVTRYCDIMKKYEPFEMLLGNRGHYRTISYARAETVSLADQLRKLA
jgi:hypothetical protein